MPTHPRVLVHGLGAIKPKTVNKWNLKDAGTCCRCGIGLARARRVGVPLCVDCKNDKFFVSRANAA